MDRLESFKLIVLVELADLPLLDGAIVLLVSAYLVEEISVFLQQ